VHPFYAPRARRLAGRGAAASGLVSMAAYLAFWAVALGIALHELDARWPRGRSPAGARDAAWALLRERFARGEIDEAEFRARADVLRETYP